MSETRKEEEIRCEMCGELLVKCSMSDLARVMGYPTIARGALKQMVGGSFQLMLNCHKCRLLNMIAGFNSSYMKKIEGK